MKFVTYLRYLMFALAVTMVIGSPKADAQVSSDVVELADGAVGRVMVTDKQGCCGFGSGFVFAPLPDGDGYYFLTNQHVIEGLVSAYVGFKKNNRVYKYDVTVASVSYERDMAVLEIRPRENFDHTPQILTIREGEIKKGEPVAAVGFPYTSDLSNESRNEQALFETTLTQGHVSKVSQGTILDDRGTQEIIQHTAAFNKGNSGGPTIDSCGTTLGLNTSLADGTYFASSANSISRYLRDNNFPFTSHSNSCDPDNPDIVRVGASPDNLWVILAVLCGAGAAVVGGMYYVASNSKEGAGLISGSAKAAKQKGRAILSLSLGGKSLKVSAAQLRAGVTIGRASENTLVVGDRDLSRRHASLSLEGRKIMLTDLGSSNGTKVDGRRLKPNEPVQINTKSKVALGGIDLVLRRT